MKRVATLLAVISMNILTNAQNENKTVFVKANALFAPIGMINIGIEKQFFERITFQADAFVSPWKSFAGSNAQVYMGTIEGRYYFDKAFNKLYFGVNAGTGFFNITKWGHTDGDQFQKGFTFLLGGTIGYQISIAEKWNLDLYLGGGISEAFYHGYAKNEYGEYFRYDKADGWNKSAEWLPYKGGLMISYKIK